MLEKLIDRLAGIRQAEGGNWEDSQTTRDYAGLVRKAKNRIRISSGHLPRTVYNSNVFTDALNKVQRNNPKTVIDVITGPQADSISIEALRRRGATITVLKSEPEQHFSVVDGQHVRLEEPHEESSDACVQYIVHNYIHAAELEKYFLSLKTSS